MLWLHRISPTKARSKKLPTSKRDRTGNDALAHESKRPRRTKNITNTADSQNNKSNNDHHDQDNNHNGLNEDDHSSSSSSSSSVLNGERRTNHHADLNGGTNNPSSMDKCITITYGEQAENHKGMQKIGELADTGFTTEQLKDAQRAFESQGYQCEYVSLTDVNPEVAADSAAILVVRGGGDAVLTDLPEPKNSQHLFEEHSQLDIDKKARMRGRVVNKHARHNLCFDDIAQEPEYEQGKGRIIAFDDVPLTAHIRNRLPHYLGVKAKALKAEGNYYYDLKKCYIGFHGDSERKIVIAVRLGAPMPLYYQWYHHGEPVGNRITLTLNHGDIYIMSEKATGWDWKRSSIHTLRHAAGPEALISRNTKKKKTASSKNTISPSKENAASSKKKTSPSKATETVLSSTKKASSRKRNNDVDIPNPRTNKHRRTMDSENHTKEDSNSITERQTNEESNHPISNNIDQQSHSKRRNDHTELNPDSENETAPNAVADSGENDEDNITTDDNSESNQHLVSIEYGKLTFSIPMEHLSDECCNELLQSIKAPLIPEQLSDSSQSIIHRIISVVEHIDNHQKARFPFLHAWLILIMLHQVSLLPSESSEDKKRAAEELENVTNILADSILRPLV